jgi:hypothetical protein
VQPVQAVNAPVAASQPVAQPAAAPVEPVAAPTAAADAAPSVEAKPDVAEANNTVLTEAVPAAASAKRGKLAAKGGKPVKGAKAVAAASTDEEPAAEVAEKPAAKPVSVDDVLGDEAEPEPTKVAKAEPAKAEPAKSRSIDDLIDNAVVNPAAKPASNLPEQPSRDDVVGAMRGIESTVQACGATDGVTGVAEVAITVSGTTGRVTNAVVSGITGPTGSCIAKAARAASFPKFSKPTFSVKYPYKLK